MSAVHARDTGPELLLRRALWAGGLRGFRVRPPLPGHPDIAFSRSRVAVFVDGCYWHGCPEHYSAPRTRAEFWAAKLHENVARDRAADAELVGLGWTPLHVWVHELRELDKAVARVRAATFGSVDRSRPTTPQDYGGTVGAPWYQCGCGSLDVQVKEVAGHGSLKPQARYPISSVVLICRHCGRETKAAPHSRLREVTE